MKTFRFFALTLALLAHSLLFAAPYDPLHIPDGKITSLEIEVKDAGRDRSLPLRVYLPETRSPAPVILFSHGLGGSRDNNPYLGNHWAARGYVVVFVQHPGSDESVWKDTGPMQRMAAMKQAASAKNFLLRNKDIPAVIDALRTLACAVPMASGVAVASGMPSPLKRSSRIGTAMMPPPTPSNP
ncbi:MAG: hypothetical protein ABI600_10005, partial [Luteolibacter sp.]